MWEGVCVCIDGLLQRQNPRVVTVLRGGVREGSVGGVGEGDPIQTGFRVQGSGFRI